MTRNNTVLKSDKRFDGSSGSVSCLTVKYQKESSAMRLHDNLSIFKLPGQDKITNDMCGVWVHPLGCPDYGQPTIDGSIHDRFVTQHSCDKPSCPSCYETWASKASERAFDRLKQCIELYRRANYQITLPSGRSYLIGRVDHYIFSPPGLSSTIERLKTLDGYRELKKEAVGFAKKSGIVGGVIIFHPFRQNDPRESNYRNDLPAYVWYMSPHFHIVGCGFTERSDLFYQRTGWIIKKLPRRESVKGTIRYTLTHCGIVEGVHALTYFGIFSYNKVVIDQEIKQDTPIKCSACGQSLHLYGWQPEKELLEPNWKDDRGVYFHKVVKRTYKLRQKDNYGKLDIPGTM